MSKKPDSRTVATWMLGELKRATYLYQNVVVTEIIDRFGDEFTTINENGNYAIDRRVLAEFRKLTDNTVVWDRTERCWRERADYDEPGRRQG